MLLVLKLTYNGVIVSIVQSAKVNQLLCFVYIHMVWLIYV